MADPVFGTQGNDNIDGTGGNDWIQSLDGDDVIRGLGGRDALWSGGGDDVMYGGDVIPGGDSIFGNDTYHITSLGDIIVEYASEGTADRIHSYISYDMTAAAEVENMRLVGFAAGIDGWGNDLDNTIEGNREVNMLFGGNGNDAFIVHDILDVVDGEAGNNTVMVDFTAFLATTATWTNIQNITLTGEKNINATGDANDNILTGNEGRNILTGGLGNDTYVIGTTTSDTIKENTGEGTDTIVVEATYSLSKWKYVENLTLAGTGSYKGTGNALNNIITGNASNNTLDGGAGADAMFGGDGGDVYIVDNAGDTVTNFGGIDLAIASVSYNLTTNGSGVQNLTLKGKSAIFGIGDLQDNIIIGYTNANTLDGMAGNDTLDGGKGNDTLIGGTGDDTYFVDSALDIATEGATPGGTDIVMANIKAKTTFVLDADIENLTLTGKNGANGTGNALNNIIIGNTGANILSGLDGADTITGTGGKNTMSGGAGNDTITGGSAADIIAGDDDDDTLSGGGGDDTITGGAGNDTITGGAGKDIVAGGAGDDLYVISDDDDTATENAGEGTDLVEASVSYVLGANFENLTLKGGAVFGIGNALVNTIEGNGGANTLDGGGGDDTLIGNAGNDIYLVDSANDAVIEAVNEGTLDTIRSTVSYDISASATGEVEILQLMGGGNIDGTGNAFDNTLIGNAGVNTLSGGDGNDTFIVDLTDAVIENAGEGTLDTIHSAFTYTLAPSSPVYEVEGLTLTGTDNINGTGNDLDNRIQGNAGINTLAGTTGSDTYVIVNLAETQFDVIIENAGEGAADTIESFITYVLGASSPTYEMENLTLAGTANIHGTGNDLDNTITGNSGNNTLDGSTGADTMAGGEGDDTFVVDDAGDVVTENPGEGNDTILSGIDFDLTVTPDVENLTLTGAAITGAGNALANVITGNNNNNILSGGDGNDTITGGAGADAMTGGAGNDTFFVDDSNDTVTEAAGEGTDTVFSIASYDMGVQAPGEVEILTLIGGLLNINAAGNAFDNTITGNEGNNTIDGGGGDDTLDGGLGTDTLRGGAGDDLYIVNGAGKTVIESAGEGAADEVQTNMTYVLDAEVEILTLTGATNLNGTGNALDNTINGNGGNNTLDGLGGADTLAGGAGNDTYIVDNALDVVDESAGSGVDMVLTSVSYDMGAQTLGQVDNITLQGAADLDVTGNGFDNTIVGNSGVNAMAGGGGDDTYYVTAGDTVTEAAGEGTLDTVISSISWALAAGQEIEQLILTAAGGAINATGNEFGNTLVGNVAQNTFDGGLGDDTYDIGASATLDVILADTGGEDTVKVGATYSIAARLDLENITLAGTGNFNATGNDNDNTLKGTTGKNVLNGGLGADYLMGGAGDDIYHVDDAGDVIDEMDPDLPGGGKDLVIATVSYSLGQVTAETIENLTLVGPNAFNGTGNTASNYIKGNALDNTLAGGGGADTLEGFGGNDTYVIDSPSDVLKDTGGVEWVISTLPFYTLLTGYENLQLAGPAPINGTGNTGANTIIGNGEMNVIDGGKGADYMAGGDGDDIYFVDTVNDVVVELAGEGTMDTIKTKVNFVLQDSQHVEVIEHIGSAGNLAGNDKANTLIGNKGTNTLSGGGGDDTLIGADGKDILYGDAGNDTFVVDYLRTGVDIIKDYQIGSDSFLFLVDIDPLMQVLEDFVEYKYVGADTYVYVDFDAWGTDFGPKLLAIAEGVIIPQ